MHFKYLVAHGAAWAALTLFAPIATAQEAGGEVRVSETPRLASGLQLSLKLEPGLAVALSDPQSEKTELGMGHTVKLLFGLGRYVQIGPSIAYTTLPPTGTMTRSGRSWTFGGGGRLMRPHDSPGYGISPWIDADLLYVRTGDLDRPGFATAVGVSMPLDSRRRFWLGPFARYFQIIQGQRDGFDNRDAKVLMFGVGLEVTTGLQRKRDRIAIVEATPPPEPVAAVVEAPPSDRDGDGVADSADNCPEVAGLAANAGCPPYEKVVVRPEKLDVNEKIAFAWSSSKILETSHPALDEVVRALKDNPSFKVQVDGHSSSDGLDSYNQTLSEQRAAAVVDYLVAHGVAKTRLVSKGFSSSVPLNSNTTSEGRVSNRRVEFIVSFIILEKGNTP